MFRLLGLAISIGLADSLNPSTIGPALFLAGDRGAGRKVAAFTLATFGVFLLGGSLLVIGPGRAILAVVPHPGATVRFVLETLIGVGLLIAAPILWRRRLHTREKARRDGGDDGRSTAGRSPLLLGATISVVELPTAFPYFAVVAAIIGSGLGLGRELLLVIAYNVCFVAPLVLIAITVGVGGEAAVGRLRRLRELLRAHWPAVAAVVAVLAGAFVTVLGITGLVGRQAGTVGLVSRKLRHLITKPTG